VTVLLVRPTGGAAAAVALLAVAVLVSGAPSGGGRIRALTGPAAGTAQPTVAALRVSWVAVGAAALGALVWSVAGGPTGVVVGGAAGAAGLVAARRSAAGGEPDDTGTGAFAGSWELLAVCLEAGLPVAVAVSAAAESLRGPAGAQLRRVSGLLELGADPVDAWGGAQDLPALAAFARAAGRSAGTGAALAQVARAESTRIRAELLDSAQARAQRAAVLITAPLGLCFLPAFLVLGIAPVVLGLAGEALAQW
jgi:Flp pilus assembly protein TadB